MPEKRQPRERADQNMQSEENAALRLGAYMGGVTDKPGYLTIRGEDRVRRFFGENDPGVHLKLLKRVLPFMRDKDQSAIVAYFSGASATRLNNYDPKQLDISLEKLSELLATVFDVARQPDTYVDEYGMDSATIYAAGIAELSEDVMRRTGVSEPVVGQDMTDSGEYLTLSDEIAQIRSRERQLGKAGLRLAQIRPTNGS